MAHINLLPWREAYRKQKQQEFVAVAIFAALVAGIVVFFVHIHMNGLIEHQEARNRFLENEIKILDKKIAEIKELEATKKALLDRMNIIQELQVARPGIVHLFDELVTTLPDGVYLTSLKQKGSSLSITGRAESKARVAAYMRNLNASEWLASSDLSVIESKDAQRLKVSQFSLTVKQTSPGAPLVEEKQSAATGKGKK